MAKKDYYDRRKAEAYNAIKAYVNRIRLEIDNLKISGYIQDKEYNAIKYELNKILDNINEYKL